MKRLGNVYKRITRKRAVRIQDSGEPQISVHNLDWQICDVEIVMTEHRLRAFVKEMRSRPRLLYQWRNHPYRRWS